MKIGMQRASLALVSPFLLIPFAATTGCNSGRMALAIGLHSRPESDEAILAGTVAPSGDIAIQRHARPEPSALQSRTVGFMPNPATVSLEETRLEDEGMPAH